MYTHRSINELRGLLTDGKTSCTEIVRSYLNTIGEKKHLNAFVEVYGDEALSRAAALDAKKNNPSSWGQLYGVVIGIKDVLCFQDHTITAGSKILSNYECIYTATAVQRLLDADAIIIGSLNCDEFAMGSSNENSFHGKVHNALDVTRVPGGSSGGSAVAVQANMCMVSLGTDTGGSVRQPADFCGIIGMKPGYGRISRYGLIAYASSFDQIGIFAKQISDVALTLEVIAGEDAYDSTCSPAAVPAYQELLKEKKQFRMAYFPESLEHPSLDPEIRENIASLILQLREEGHVVEPVSFTYLDHIVPAYYVLTTAEASSNLSRFDGVKFGYRTPGPVGSLDELYKKSRSEGFGKEVKKRIMLGTFVLSTGYYDAYYAKAQQVRRLIAEKTKSIFSTYDLILMPTVPAPAFKFGEKSKDAVEMFLGDLYTVYANLAGIAGISLPLFKHSNGMPYGVQLMSDRLQEDKLLQCSAMLLEN